MSVGLICMYRWGGGGERYYGVYRKRGPFVAGHGPHGSPIQMARTLITHTWHLSQVAPGWLHLLHSRSTYRWNLLVFKLIDWFVFSLFLLYKHIYPILFSFIYKFFSHPNLHFFYKIEIVRIFSWIHNFFCVHTVCSSVLYSESSGNSQYVKKILKTLKIHYTVL